MSGCSSCGAWPVWSRDELGVTYLMCWMNFGGLASDLARDSIRRFAEQVIPKFR